ncbi:Peptidase S8/S53 domain-containing protein [Cinnamomum micranthum f. kanehirae]|uniref:Peptidase S8/S53 domain-containing protein n=1 Tax=Cinnamomum micranthum f. kanehirae TaxID=337451 RepID=A0A443PAC4_9MAGN|nr:Peptidase S8/S53 domain-containing protein [Cinnamomum micranthum f. kanehirae]
MDRSFPSPITLGNNQTIMVTCFLLCEMIYSSYFESPCGGSNYDNTSDSLRSDNSTMRGKVVLCFGYLPHGASEIIKAAGGVGLIIANSPTNYISPCDDLPRVKVDYDVGAQLLSYIRSSRKPVVKLSPSKTLVGMPLSAKIAHFSSRGPISLSPEILKPDVTAPGVNVLAAMIPKNEDAYDGFAFDSGTSMACPHVAGIVALLKSLHPSWSPAAIRSALTTTASTTDTSGEPIFTIEEAQKLAGPFDFGGGIVNPNRASETRSHL